MLKFPCLLNLLSSLLIQLSYYYLSCLNYYLLVYWTALCGAPYGLWRDLLVELLLLAEMRFLDLRFVLSYWDKEHLEES